MSELEELQNEAARIVSTNSVSYRNAGPAIAKIRELIRQAHVAGYQLRGEDEQATDTIMLNGAHTLEVGELGFLVGVLAGKLAAAIDAASDQDPATWLTRGGKRIAIIAPADAVYAPEDEPEEKPQHR